MRALSVIVLILVVVSFAHLACALSRYSPHSGYLKSGENERDSDFGVDWVVPKKPAEPIQSLSERIFDPTISYEFKRKFEDKFGPLELQRSSEAHNRYMYANETSLFGFRGSLEDEDRQKRDFGNYMNRRLLEYHVDRYAKTDPQMKAVWEAKEKISNIKVQVKEFRFDFKYSIAGNTFSTILINPYVNSRVELQMKSSQVGPAPIEETLLVLEKDVTPKVNTEARYFIHDGIVSWSTSRRMTDRLSSSATMATFTRPADRSLSRRESLYLIGAVYVF